MKRLLFCILASFFFSGMYAQSTFYVPQNYPTIQNAINQGLFSDKEDFTNQVNILDLAQGGIARQNFAMGRRAFLKLMGGVGAGIGALKTGAFLIPFFGRRKSDGQNFEVIFEDPIPHSDSFNMTKDMSERLEAQVKMHPEQWFWVHRRWKPRRQQLWW